MDSRRWLVLALGLFGCVRTQMPDPRAAAREYERAVRTGDAAALHALLSREAQGTYSEQDLRELLKNDGKELLANAAACVDPASELTATAVVTGGSNVLLGLALEEGVFHIDSDMALFPRPRTPEAAAEALEQALASGSTQRVEAVLSADRRADLEERRDALIESLADLDQAAIRVLDHRATIELPDGQLLELVEEDGVWRVEAVP